MGQKLTKPQMLLLQDLAGGSIWILGRRWARPAAKLCELGLAEWRRDNLHITKAGRAALSSASKPGER